MSAGIGSPGPGVPDAPTRGLEPRTYRLQDSPSTVKTAWSYIRDGVTLRNLASVGEPSHGGLSWGSSPSASFPMRDPLVLLDEVQGAVHVETVHSRFDQHQAQRLDQWDHATRLGPGPNEARRSRAQYLAVARSAPSAFAWRRAAQAAAPSRHQGRCRSATSSHGLIERHSDYSCAHSSSYVMVTLRMAGAQGGGRAPGRGNGPRI